MKGRAGPFEVERREQNVLAPDDVSASDGTLVASDGALAGAHSSETVLEENINEEQIVAEAVLASGPFSYILPAALGLPAVFGHTGGLAAGTQLVSAGARAVGSQVTVGTRSQAKVVNLFEHKRRRGERQAETADETIPCSEELTNLPVRNYDCPNYSTCLGMAAALDWNSFSCKGCNGCVNQQLLWRAHQKVRNNKPLQQLCGLPILQ